MTNTMAPIINAATMMLSAVSDMEMPFLSTIAKGPLDATSRGRSDKATAAGVPLPRRENPAPKRAPGTVLGAVKEQLSAFWKLPDTYR